MARKPDRLPTGSARHGPRPVPGRKPPRGVALPPTPPAPGTPLPLGERLRMRDEFFLTAGIDPREFLRAFETIADLCFFVKDAASRMMLTTEKYTPRIGVRGGDDIVGLRNDEYQAREVAAKYQEDDQKVYQTGQPLRNIIEIGFNELGLPDWIVTDKYPLRDAAGRVVGIIGTMQSLEGRLHSLSHLGAAGRAVDYIRRNLGGRMSLGDIATHVGLSERHLQRLFHQFVGMTIRRFVIHSRVHAAAHVLTHSERPMAAIALMFGFTDQSAFTNTFRKVVGVPPREYRKRFRQDLIP